MRLGSKVFLICVLWSALASGQHALEKQRLDFSQVGVYATLFDFCDFSVYKIRYFGERAKPENLQPWRARLHDAVGKGKRNLVGLYCFDRVKHTRPIEEYIANADAILQAIDIKDVYAVFLSEENVTWNNGLEILNALYDHIKAHYDVPVYQWYSMPMVAHPKQRADGWIIDPYGMKGEQFRKYLVKYVVMGKPVIDCLFASPEGRHSGRAAERLAATRDQIATCREFNVPMFFFCVDPKLGSPNVWLRSDEPEIAEVREWLLGEIEKIHATDTATLPLPSAQFSQGQAVEVAGDEQNRFEFVENFATEQFVDDATIAGLLDLRWDGAKEALCFEPATSERHTVELQYHFVSEFKMSGVEAQLFGEAPKTNGTALEVALSMDGRNWSFQDKAPPAQHAGPRKFTLKASARKAHSFAGDEFWARIRGLAGKPGIRLDRFSVSCDIEPPKHREVRLIPDEEGKVSYRDDFSSQKYLHLSYITNKKELTWQRGHLGTHGVAGKRNQVMLRWKFLCDKPLAQLKVCLECSANERSLGSWNNLAVSLDGENTLAEDTTRGKPTNKIGSFRGTLTLDLSGDERFHGVSEFWVHAEMISASNKATKQSNAIKLLEVQASTQ